MFWDKVIYNPGQNAANLETILFEESSSVIFGF